MAGTLLVAEKKSTTSWYVGNDPIVSENRDGSYTIIDWHSLDEVRLKRLHAVLGQMLMDLVNKELVATR